MKEDPHKEGHDDAELSSDAPKGLTGLFSHQIPVDKIVWDEARKLIGDAKVRVEDLATCCLQDPVFVIELLRKANALYFSGGRPPITSTTTAITRLGSKIVREVLESLIERPAYTNEEVVHWLSLHRGRGRRTAIVARVLAETLAKTLSDDCQAAGLLSTFGEMLAVGFFQEKYVALAEDLNRTGVIFRLAQDQKFDCERMGILYLRRHGIPESLLFALDREAIVKNPERALMKPLVMSASEMVDAFDNNRWERLAPGKQLSAKSHLRLLQFTDAQYLKVYERVGEYLYGVRLLEEKKRASLVKEQSQKHESAVIPLNQEEGGPSLQDEIQSLLSGFILQSTEIVTTDIPFTPEPVVTRDHSKPRTGATTIVIPPTTGGIRGEQIAQELMESFSQVSSSEELLTELLSMLLANSLFEKTALIVVAKDKKSAQVVAARGPNLTKGLSIPIDDPLSPLAECFSKVQSFGTKESKHSPFGSKSFAIAPLDVDHETPVALYADCGKNGSISFEARRVFRSVVELLNQKLPQLPGGIPIEIDPQS